jgi:hypothetical protein
MVVNKNEVKTIMKILREYWTESSIEMVLQQVWESVGKHSENVSLQETIIRMKEDKL